jgi:hypothetical protein
VFRGNCTEGLVSMLVWTQGEEPVWKAHYWQDKKAKSKTSPSKIEDGAPKIVLRYVHGPPVRRAQSEKKNQWGAIRVYPSFGKSLVSAAGSSSDRYM